jgi:hypothetical protein
MGLRPRLSLPSAMECVFPEKDDPARTKIVGSLSLTLDEFTGPRHSSPPVIGRRAVNPAGTALRIPSINRS